MIAMNSIELVPIGVIHSPLKRIEDAPLFYTEGAPGARIEILTPYRDALLRMRDGDEIIVITWLHLGQRDVLQVHPRDDRKNPLTGVFSTRSPDRPNPLGLHRAKVLAVHDGVIEVDAIEAIDGTPVVDIKMVVGEARDE